MLRIRAVLVGLVLISGALALVAARGLWPQEVLAAPAATSSTAVVATGNPKAAWVVAGNKVFYVEKDNTAILRVAASGALPDEGVAVQVVSTGVPTSAWALVGRKVFYLEKDQTTILKVTASASF